MAPDSVLCPGWVDSSNSVMRCIPPAPAGDFYCWGQDSEDWVRCALGTSLRRWAGDP